MVNRSYYLILLLGACTLCQCTNDTSADATTPDATTSETSDSVVKPKRNMFGHGLERGIITNTKDATPGYVFFIPTNSATPYLMNRDGEIVHQWKSNYGLSGGYLLNDGSIAVQAYDVDFPVFAGGGEAGRIQKISWEGKMLWDFEYANEKHHAHHDIAVMPNGNVLTIAWEFRTTEEAIALGRDPDAIPVAGLWPDKIVEIKPNGKYGGDIVWEWHIWDHVIQDFDASKANYGDPADHPELLDINISSNPLKPLITQDSMDILHATGDAWRNRTIHNFGSDIYHCNAINYNPELDQIVFSSPRLSEIFIIDHSTSTEQAAGHEGGKRGKGGDFLYRWGNPENYRHGDSTDRQLHHQHDIRWIEDGMPGAGNLTVFNNAIPNGPDSLNYSAVQEISPTTDANGNYVLSGNGSYATDKPIWEYLAPDTISFFSGFISGAHRMKNGNTFINEGAKGRFFEITPEGETVWNYLMPYRGNIKKPNGDEYDVMPMVHLQFRTTFISEDHPGIAGRELSIDDPQPEFFKMPEKKEDEVIDN